MLSSPELVEGRIETQHRRSRRAAFPNNPSFVYRFDTPFTPFGLLSVRSGTVTALLSIFSNHPEP